MEEVDEFDDLKALMKVSKFHLDEEWIKQVGAYHYWAEQAVLAEEDLSRAENRLQLCRGDADLDIRKNPPDGIKITEAVVMVKVNSDKKVIACQEEVFAARKKHKLYKVAVEAMNHRKSALDGLTSLHARAYWQDPKREGQGGALHDRLANSLNNKFNQE